MENIHVSDDKELEWADLKERYSHFYNVPTLKRLNAIEKEAKGALTMNRVIYKDPSNQLMRPNGKMAFGKPYNLIRPPSFCVSDPYWTEYIAMMDEGLKTENLIRMYELEKKEYPDKVPNVIASEEVENDNDGKILSRYIDDPKGLQF
jgi:hypothetical protein